MSENIEKAIAILKSGGLVAFPTETVYGLGADATNPAAIQKVYTTKNRPRHHPVIVHIAEKEQWSDWARDIPWDATLLANAFWPGPLTLILKKAQHVHTSITGGQDSVGLRIPNHFLTLELLKKFGRGMIGPSANRFGRLSPTSAADVLAELGDQAAYIIDGGTCSVGVESTIVDLTSDQPVILRPGMITFKQICQVLQRPIAVKAGHTLRVPGALVSHYAPETRVELISTDQLLNDSPRDRCVCLAINPIALTYPMDFIKMPASPTEYAHYLYQTLRLADDQGYNRILVEKVPEDSEWDAIRDRLKKASA